MHGGRNDLHDTAFSRYRLLHSMHHKIKQGGVRYPMSKALHSIANISMMVVVRMVNRGAFLM